MQRYKGICTITSEGEEALNMSPDEIVDIAVAKYREWKLKKTEGEQQDFEQEEDMIDHRQQALISELEERALSGIKKYIGLKNAYEFQDIVAILLRSMGYHTPYTAPKGKDGGIDIVAYQDPLGIKTPKIKVQVKHKPDSKIPIDDIRSLVGVLNKDGDTGLFVTSGSFTNDAERFARDSNIHIDLIDFNRFIDLWQQYYSKMNDQEKKCLPLHPIYFLADSI